MPTSNQLYEQFGPMLLDALTKNILTEINAIRNRLGMGPISSDFLEATTKTTLSDMTIPDWLTKNDTNQ